MLSDHQVTSFSALTVDYPGRHGAVCVWGGGGIIGHPECPPGGGGGGRIGIFGQQGRHVLALYRHSGQTILDEK